MTETDEEKETRRRIDLFHKNLEFVSNAYSMAEGVFPLWEAAFALIIGQLLVAYFDPNFLCHNQRILLALIGCFISYVWFVLTSLNNKNAIHMTNLMGKLIENFNSDLKGEPKISRPFPEFISPWPTDEDKEKWTLFDIFWGKKHDETVGLALGKARKSTWFYRRILPFGLFIIWIYLLSTLNEIFGFAAIVIFFIITLILLDP